MTAAKSAPGQGPKLTVVEGAQSGSPGQRLMRARTQRNLALEDVARQLNLSVSMVKALETDNFKSLPGRAFVKGYLRNYARLVGVDASDLLRSYESQFGAGEETQLNPPDVARPPRWIAPVVKAVGYLILVAIVVGIGGVVYQNFGMLADKAQQLSASFRSEDEVVAPEETAEAAEPVESTGDTVRVSIPLHPVAGGSAAANAGGVAAGESSSSVTVEPSVAEPATSVESPATETVPPQSSAEPEASTPVTATAQVTPSQVENQASAVSAPVADLPGNAGGEAIVAANLPADGVAGSDLASLTLAFSGVSWVRVRDANDKVLFDGTRSAGGNIQLQGRAPFSIRLGNAPVVKVTLNGKARDFDFSSRSNVAQFTLDNE